MARPERNTVDYFPHLIGSGKKMSYIETKYGNDGYATWFKILETLAVTEFHFLNLSDEVELMFLSAKCKISIDKLSEIIEDLVKLKMFSKSAWDHKILWSEVFIENISDAYKRRNNKCISFEGLCIHLLGLGISIECDNTSKQHFNPQSIVKYSKEEETIVEDSIENSISDFIKELVTDFEFTENRFAVQQKKVMEFVNVLSFNNRLDHFKSQYKDYKEFKKLSGQISHAFLSFIGTVKEKFEDGAWNSDNWTKKLETEKLNQNGRNAKKANGGSRSNQGFDNSNGYSEL